MSTPTFIVGTGRCGSTMLSNMLREHSKVLSLSEFFAGLVDSGVRLDETFSPEKMDGRRFWGTVAAINPVTSFAYRHHVPCDEFLYPVDTPTSRFSAQTGVPAILVTTLPHLTDGHDRLFDLLEDEVTHWPEATMGEHYQHLFTWLAAHFDKRLWIERSGAALHMLELILAKFPDARLVHVVRDGRDASLSMLEHLGFRLYFVLSSIAQHLGVAPLESADRSFIDAVPAEWRPFLPERFDADAFRAFRVPLPLCGQYWTFQIDAGLKILRALPAERLLTLRYEDFFSEPTRQLDTFAAFLGDDFVDEDWSSRCAAMVRRPRSTWRDLPEDDTRALREACRPGFELLREAGVDYDF